jgi:hypothetical protein
MARLMNGRLMIRLIFRDARSSGRAPLPGWAALLGAAGAVALFALLVIFGLALALLLAPVAVGAFFYMRWRMKRLISDLAKAQRSAGPAPGTDRTIIDAEYTIITEDPRPRSGTPSGSRPHPTINHEP